MVKSGFYGIHMNFSMQLITYYNQRITRCIEKKCKRIICRNTTREKAIKEKTVAPLNADVEHLPLQRYPKEKYINKFLTNQTTTVHLASPNLLSSPGCLMETGIVSSRFVGTD